MNYFFTVIKTLLLICLILFAVFNHGDTTIVLIPKHFEYSIPLFIPILGALFLGGVIVGLSFIAERMRLGKELKLARKKLNAAEDELHRVRTLPLLDDENSTGKGV